MSPTAAGLLIGLVAGLGLVLVVWFAPPARPIRLADRIAPYLRETPSPSRLLPSAPAGRRTRWSAVRPRAEALSVRIDRVLGGSASVQRRLDALEDGRTVQDLRFEQLIWSATGLALGIAGGAVLTVASGRSAIASIVLLAVAGAVGGVLARDWWLTQEVRRRGERILLEFPVVADLLALAVTAGESPQGAIDRVSRLVGGELGRSMQGALAKTRAGMPLVEALEDLARTSTVEPLARFIDGLVIAMERGTPLSDVLRAQAADVREQGKRRLLEIGGRKELAMMVPVVFLVLPVTVIFALFPGLFSIIELAR